MSLWKLFSGPTPEKLTRQAETLLNAKQWGPAKVALERALEKAVDPELKTHLQAEIRICCDHLAQDHLSQAATLSEGGHQDEAAELYRLAVEIARDPRLKKAAEEGLERLLSAAAPVSPDPVYYSPSPTAPHRDDGPGRGSDADDEATFWALIGTLPEDMQDAYEAYGEPFRSGYLALNRGDFEQAAHLLGEAHKQHSQAGTYILLELAAAYTHTGHAAEARDLLNQFLHYHPDILPAYQLYCDLLWEASEFEMVDTLLARVPPELVDTVALVLLRGENYLQAGSFDTGIAYLEEVLASFGWSDPVAELLATLFTEAGDNTRARSLYGEIMQRCQSCHGRVDPMVKHNYAELSFADGQRDTQLLELYLSLAQEAPDRADLYFRRVSAIYAEQGYAAEAKRFDALAQGSLKR
jgi:tetratricopeptide (TPR) repeat protein